MNPVWVNAYKNSTGTLFGNTTLRMFVGTEYGVLRLYPGQQLDLQYVADFANLERRFRG